MLKRLYKVGRPRQLGDIWGEMWRWNGMWVTGMQILINLITVQLSRPAGGNHLVQFNISLSEVYK